MKIRYNDELRRKRYTVGVPDGSTPSPHGGITLPGVGYLPAMTFLSLPRYSHLVTILDEEPLADEIPDYSEGEFPW